MATTGEFFRAGYDNQPPLDEAVSPNQGRPLCAFRKSPHPLVVLNVLKELRHILPQMV
jgi:hypothetical protein